MPDLVLRSGQCFADFLGQQVTKLPVIGLQLLVVFCDLRLYAPVLVPILQNAVHQLPSAAIYILAEAEFQWKAARQSEAWAK